MCVLPERHFERGDGGFVERHVCCVRCGLLLNLCGLCIMQLMRCGPDVARGLDLCCGLP